MRKKQALAHFFMLLTCVLCPLTFYTISSYSQPPKTTEVDIKVLAKTFQPRKSLTYLRGNFSQIKFISALQMQIKSNGNFEVQKKANNEQSILWSILLPEKMKIKICRDKLLIENPNLSGSEKIRVINIKDQQSDMAGNYIYLMKIMDFDVESIAQDFDIRFLEKKYIFVPKNNENINLKEIQILLNKEMNIQQITLLEKNSDYLRIDFNQLRQGKLAAKSEISCSK